MSRRSDEDCVLLLFKNAICGRMRPLSEKENVESRGEAHDSQTEESEKLSRVAIVKETVEIEQLMPCSC